jgi:hypothetical protein
MGNQAQVALKFEVLVFQGGGVGVSAPTQMLREKIALLGMLELAKKCVIDFVPPLVEAVTGPPPALGVPGSPRTVPLNGTDQEHPPLRRI